MLQKMSIGLKLMTLGRILTPTYVLDRLHPNKVEDLILWTDFVEPEGHPVETRRITKRTTGVWSCNATKPVDCNEE